MKAEKPADRITRKYFINSTTEVRQLVIEDDSSSRGEDLGAKSVRKKQCTRSLSQLIEWHSVKSSVSSTFKPSVMFD